ncbi:MAG: hypothetical protein JNK05_26015 [Myxococcales bacterium]|nr:hypothetical protein [Myxococcales bacterium]
MGNTIRAVPVGVANGLGRLEDEAEMSGEAGPACERRSDRDDERALGRNVVHTDDTISADEYAYVLDLVANARLSGGVLCHISASSSRRPIPLATPTGTA